MNTKGTLPPKPPRRNVAGAPAPRRRPVQRRASSRRAIVGLFALALLALAAGLTAGRCAGTPHTAAPAAYTSPYDWEGLERTGDRLAYYENGELRSDLGVDVSSHQGAIDWPAVAADGVDFAIVRAGNRGYTEVALYADELAARPRIVVANKTDVPGTEEACEALAARVREDSIAAAGGNEFVESPIDPKLYRISALTGAGVDSLKAAIATKVHALREAAREQAASDMQYDHVWELRREAREKRFDIISEGPGAWRVSGVQVERMVVQTDWENEEAVAFFQHRFKRMGVDTALEKAGARDGDEVRILGFSFAFESPTAGAVDVYQELDI